jgi:LasA protease
MFFLSTVTCSWVTEYWIPPQTTPTLPPELAILLDTPDPSLRHTQTPVPTDPPGAVIVVTDSFDPATTAIPTLVDYVTPILYYAQAADTLPTVAIRFGVKTEEITSPTALSQTSLLEPGQLLIIPRRLANTTSPQHILPDSELVNSPSAADFDIDAYVNQAGGKLSRHKEWLKSTGTLTGAQVVQRVATENSINPRLLLALLEYQSGWVYGEPANIEQEEYPLGKVDPRYKGLFHQLVWAVNELSTGYYAWREGRLIELDFVQDGYKVRLAPDLNAGSVAMQFFFAQIMITQKWVEAVDLEIGFPSLYTNMFGNYWQRAQNVEPLYPPGLSQPELSLPFQKGRIWSFTGGPHGAWEGEGSYAALDFAPSSSEPGCVDSNAWATASASGLVVRSGNGVVVLDLDGDGFEQTGWVVLYLHVSKDSGVPVGTWVDRGDILGHPSCEGGHATGTHVHIARKFNGEWIAADGPMAFNLSGWITHYGGSVYSGYLTRGEEKVIACTCSTRATWIKLDDNAP